MPVIGEIWTSNRIYSDLAEVCAIGSRFAGSSGEQRARALVLDRLRSAGLANIHTWPFQFTAWERGTCRVELSDPSVPLTSAISLVGSPSTPPSGLEAEILDLGAGPLEEFERRSSEIAGRVVVVSSATAPGTRPAHRREKYGWAVERGAAGFVYVNHLPGMLPLTGSLRPDRPGEIPAVGVSFEDGALIRSAGRSTIRLILDNRSRQATAENLFGEIPGRSDELVIVNAHYDAHDISPSALDNGSGLVTSLELARVLAPLAGQLRRTIRFAYFTVEEWGVVGSAKYVSGLPDAEADRIALAVNLDTTSGIGPRIWSVNGFSELTPHFRRFSQEMGYEFGVTEEITTNSDHFPYVVRGIPSVWLRGSEPADSPSRRYILTPADTLDKASRRDMKESAMVTAQIILRAAEAPQRLARHRSLAEVQAMLQAQGLEGPLRAQDKWPA
jgi:Zn-dependent M28 family amino/carboxypeptidase